jgi:hypothetical protein
MCKTLRLIPSTARNETLNVTEDRYKSLILNPVGKRLRAKGE